MDAVQPCCRTCRQDHTAPPCPILTPPLPQRPSLLLDGEWEQVPGGVAALAARYNEEQVARLATAEPLLLVEELEHVLQELGRWVVWAGWCCGQGGVVGGCWGRGFDSGGMPVGRVWPSMQCTSPLQQPGPASHPACFAHRHAADSCRGSRRCSFYCRSHRWPAACAACSTSACGSVTPAGSAAGLPAGLWARGATRRPCCCVIRRWCTACSGAADPWAPAPSSDQSM